MAFKQQLIEVFLFAGTIAGAVFTVDHLFHKIRRNKYEIEYLSSRLEECEKSRESSQEHQLKK